MQHNHEMICKRITQPGLASFPGSLLLSGGKPGNEASQFCPTKPTKLHVDHFSHLPEKLVAGFSLRLPPMSEK